MVQLIVGLKGSGKTKTLIEMVNSTVEKTDGAVICVERDHNLVHAVKYQARLVDTDEYNVTTWRALYGFIAGIAASNHDAKDIFVDSLLKILEGSVEDLTAFVEAIAPFAEKHEIRLVMTVSMAKEELPAELQQYC